MIIDFFDVKCILHKYTNLVINIQMGDPPNGKSLKLRYPSFGQFISSISKLNELEKDKF